MATKLNRKTLPPGKSAGEFSYQGRPAKDQNDFGSDVGLADMACVNQFGEANNAKYYHGGVVKATDGSWFVYLEWGRMKSARSWNGSFGGGDFQFVACSGETEARSFFATQMASKNTKRLRRTVIAGVEVWAAKDGSDGYLVQDLATREKGLPDAYKIKDSAGIKAAPARTATPVPKAAVTHTYQPQVVDFARALVGGTKTFTRAMSAASGVTPTMDSITKVRDQLIPAALKRIKDIGDSIDRQVRDRDLRDLTKMVAALVPRPIPRSGQTEADFILSGGNLLALQADLDAFEAALTSEDFEVDQAQPSFDPNAALGCADIRWLDPNGEGKWLADAFKGMTNNRHGYLRGKPLAIRNIFAVSRPAPDAQFKVAVEKVANSRKGRFTLRANLQPRRQDLTGWETDGFAQANVILGIHGTRPVNFAPILQTNFRLPKSLPGAQISGANFGHGVYFATDVFKSYGYTGRGVWGHSGGDVRGRGCFMFLCDMLMGDAYRAPSTGSWTRPPEGKDSVFGVGGDRGHRLENDEHIIFDPNYQRIRYVVEFDWLT